MKKIFAAALLISSFSLLLITTKNVTATEAPSPELTSSQTIKEDVPESITINSIGTASYYYWRQTKSTFKENKYISNWIEYDRVRAYSTGQIYGMIFNHSQRGTVSVDISVAGQLLGGSISYTPGNSMQITGTAHSQPLTGGKTYISQYRKKEKIYNIFQKKYWYDLGIDYDTGITKTGLQSFPTTPDARWILQYQYSY